MNTNNSKRVNTEFHRLDVKLPIAVYEQISEIAVNSFDAKIHHISNKPEITSTLIYLLELGIESFTNGGELSKKPNTDYNTDTIPITDNEVKELIKKALLPMCERLNDLVTIQSQVDELKTILYRLTNTDNYTDTNIYVENLKNTIDVSTSDIIPITNTDNNTDNVKEDITDSIAVSESSILPSNEDLPNNAPDTKNKPVNGEIIQNDSELAVTECENTAICDTEEKELTPKQKEVMEKISSIPVGEAFSQNKLSKALEVSRSVLTSFDKWQSYFDFKDKQYIKL